MKEQEKYKQMMDEIHVSEATLRKVMDMDRNKKIANKRKMMKRVGTIAAALLLCLGATNGISYAKTGHSLMAKVIFYINGEKVEKNVAFDESGNGSISFEVKEATKGECSVEVGDAADENGNSISSDVSSEEDEMLKGTVI